MAMFNNPFSFFNLVRSAEEAETVVETIACYGTDRERQHLLPQVIYVRETQKHTEGVQSLNRILARYIARYGDFSDRLLIQMGKDLASFYPSRTSF